MNKKALGPSVNVEGWSCPINFGPEMDVLNFDGDPHASVMQEFKKLLPQYDISKKNRRTNFDISDLEFIDIIQYLIDFIGYPDAKWLRPDMPRYQYLKLCIDDLRAFY